jgi:tetraacyldisaccharide 4'-kinase
LVGRFAFADHHPYNPDEIMRLVEFADSVGAVPVTTAKDAVRLPPSARAMVHVLPVSVTWDDPGAIRHLLTPYMTSSLPNAQ